MTISTKIKTITPEYAKTLLENTKVAGVLNRKLNHRVVTEYAKEMLASRWKLNSESIKLDEDGLILDGQHRLMACIEAKVPFQTLMACNVPRDTFDTIDCGRVRTGTQVLQMSGVQYHTVITGIINGLVEFRSYGHMASKERHLTPSAVLEEYNAHPDKYDEAARVAMRCIANGHLMTAKVVGTLYYALVNDIGANKEKVEEFFAGINSFESSENQAINKMRRWNCEHRDRKVSNKLRVAYIIKSWNAFVTNSKPPRFSENDDEPMPSFVKNA
jgi:hypothetical protein